MEDLGRSFDENLLQFVTLVWRLSFETTGIGFITLCAAMAAIQFCFIGQNPRFRDFDDSGETTLLSSVLFQTAMCGLLLLIFGGTCSVIRLLMGI